MYSINPPELDRQRVPERRISPSAARSTAICNRYISPDDYEIESYWHVRQNSPPKWVKAVFPRAQGPFIRRAKDATDYERELVTGQWGLIPWFAKEPKLKFPTNNARSEELEQKASYKDPWKRGQRCIIPARSFDEPNWETGKNQWWAFRRADGAPWAWRGCGTPGSTRPPARSTRATRCSRSTPTSTR